MQPFHIANKNRNFFKKNCDFYYMKLELFKALLPFGNRHCYWHYILH